jgi:phosphoserine phosphatase SerB
MEPRYKLVAFDVNIPLAQEHTIIGTGALAGKRDEVAYYIKQHTTGKMNLSNALMEACKLLEGVEKSHVEGYSRTLPLTPGIQAMVDALTSRGVVLAMITTGFRTTMDIINERVGNAFKYVICNDLVYDKDGRATGGVKFSVMENESKVDRLMELAKTEGLMMHECAAVGDSMGDWEMLKAAGLGIAFTPNNVLEENAIREQMPVIKESDLRLLLPYIIPSSDSRTFEVI